MTQVKTVVMDKTVVDQVAKVLGIDEAYGGLLPDGKVEKVEVLKKEGKK